MSQNDSSYSLQSFLAFVNNNFVVLLLVLFFFAGGFVVGSLWTENQVMKNGGVAAGPAAGAQGVAQPPSAAGPTTEQLGNIPAVSDEDYSTGASDPVVTLVEYSDFNCSYCQRFHPIMKQVMEEYGDKVAWVYRHLPILGSAQHAEAAECIGKLGGDTAYWSFVNYYFETIAGTPARGDLAQLTEAAQVAGVDTAQFTSCVESGEMKAKVDAQMQAAMSAGLTGTPGTVVFTKDGAQELIPGALPFAEVSTIIEKYL